MKLTINNHRWTIQDSAIYGLCETAERLISIDPRLGPRHRMEIIVHELLHALDGDLTEDMVISQSQTIAEALWRDGYRRRVRKHG
jgi:hypothetical protein